MNWLTRCLERAVVASYRDIEVSPDAASIELGDQSGLWEGRIRKTPGICGGSARIGNTRIAVWYLVSRVLGGSTPERIARDYPHIDSEDVELAMHYFAINSPEIVLDLHENEIEGFEYLPAGILERKLASGAAPVR